MPKKLTQEEFIQRAKAKHGDKYDYSKVEYKGCQSMLIIGCPNHGEFIQKAYHHLYGYGCTICAYEHQRKLVYGVGVLDIISGDTKPYHLWKGILLRCYEEKYRSQNKTYKDCEVCDEWKYFSNFKDWFDNPNNGYRVGYHLDKDILVKGNKVYSPDTCCFVPIEINSLLTTRKNHRGNLPIGVSKVNSKYQVRVSFGDGKPKYLGVYPTIEEAFNAYKQAKEKHIKEIAQKYFNEGKIIERVYNALMKYEVEITD